MLSILSIHLYVKCNVCVKTYIENQQIVNPYLILNSIKKRIIFFVK